MLNVSIANYQKKEKEKVSSEQSVVNDMKNPKSNKEWQIEVIEIAHEIPKENTKDTMEQLKKELALMKAERDMIYKATEIEKERELELEIDGESESEKEKERERERKRNKKIHKYDGQKCRRQVVIATR